jgi:hypothetical protein
MEDKPKRPLTEGEIKRNETGRKNLKPRKKGDKGQPGAGLKGKTWKWSKNVFRDQLMEMVTIKDLQGNDVTVTVLQGLGLSQIKRALKGDTRAATFLLERTEGKIITGVEVEEQDVKPVEIVIVDTRKK